MNCWQNRMKFMLKVSIGGRSVGALDRARRKTFAFSYATEIPRATPSL